MQLVQLSQLIQSMQSMQLVHSASSSARARALASSCDLKLNERFPCWVMLETYRIAYPF
jgi:hypothetical protein